MEKYIDKELADAMKLLRRNCISRDCDNCCFGSDKGCYLLRKAPQNWKTETVIIVKED